MKKIVIGLAAIILVLSGLLASKYIYTTDNYNTNTQIATGEIIDTGEAQLPEDSTGDDNNDNVVKKPETTNSKSVNQDLKKSLQSKANILVSEVDTKLKLSKIKIKREKCDEENAFYDSQTKDITICDEMITQLYNYAQKESTDPKIQEEITENSLFFILFHELGHGYIDMYQLPITGKEEDVADQIATYLILGLNKDTSYTWISDGAFTFYKFAEDNPINDGGLADVHSLDKQRFYNISCWLYGANKDESIISQRGLPQERAEGCEDEYNLMKDSLDTLLKQ